MFKRLLTALLQSFFLLIAASLVFLHTLTAQPLGLQPAAEKAAATSLIYNFSEDPSREGERRHRAPLLRFGFSGFALMNFEDEDLNYYYDTGYGFFMEWDYWRLRSDRGNGFDFYSRFTYRLFTVSDETLESETDLIFEKNYNHIFSFDFGARAVWGFYFFGQLWQAYILAAPRLVIYHARGSDSKVGSSDSALTLYSIGVIGGVGLEMTILENVGLFAEYNYGYTPVGESERNIEGHQGWFGITWRTLHNWRTLRR